MEIDKLKRILLSRDQLILFDTMPKPTLTASKNLIEDYIMRFARKDTLSRTQALKEKSDIDKRLIEAHTVKYKK